MENKASEGHYASLKVWRARFGVVDGVAFACGSFQLGRHRFGAVEGITLDWIRRSSDGVDRL